MTEPTEGIRFRPSGDISLKFRGEELWIYLPTIGEREKIDVYGKELADEINQTSTETLAKLEGVRGLMEQVQSAQEAGDDDLATQLREQVSGMVGEQSEAAEALNAKVADHSLRWITFTAQTCGSDNWPADPKDYPSLFRTSRVVRQIKEHWDNVPLPSSDPQNPVGGVVTPQPDQN